MGLAGRAFRDISVLSSIIKGTVSREFLLLVFFPESSSPKPLIKAVESFRIFLKIRGEFCKSRCITDARGKFATNTASFVEIDGKFANVVNDTRGK
jgi:hypothetical protein